MLGFLARRLVYLVPVLLAVSLLTFLIASLLPGDLAYVILGDQATPEKVAALRHDMGLDQPIWWRYLGWLGHMLEGDLGRSFRTGQSVLQAVGERLPVSIELMLLAETIGLLIGVPLAIACAARAGGAFDRFVTGAAFGMLSMPTFLSAILLIYLFAVELHLLPATGYAPFAEDPAANLRFFILPALTLGLAEWPGIMRVLRSDMIATLQEDFIAGAEALPDPVRSCAKAIVADAGDGHRHQYRAADRWRCDRGVDLCPAGHRPADRQRDLHPRPRHPAGRGAAGRRRLRGGELHCRHALRRSRSEDPPWPHLNSGSAKRLLPRLQGGHAGWACCSGSRSAGSS
jgi:ABC-type dipeptide/oligopeptide/nickel transport system permease subunit